MTSTEYYIAFWGSLIIANINIESNFFWAWLAISILCFIQKSFK